MTTIYHGVSVPDLTDPPNAPDQFRRLVDTGGAVPRFTTLAEANVAYPAGQRPVGMMVAIGTRMYISDGTNFTSVAAGGVENFATAAARASAIPSPGLNVTTTLSTDPGILFVWDGSLWQPVIEGRPYGRITTTTDAATGAVNAATGPVMTFTLAGARCVAINVNAGQTRGQSGGLVGAAVLLDGSVLSGSLVQSYHASIGKEVWGGITVWVDLTSGSHTVQFQVRAYSDGNYSYLLANSRIVVADAGANRGLFPR